MGGVWAALWGGFKEAKIPAETFHDLIFSSLSRLSYMIYYANHGELIDGQFEKKKNAQAPT